MLWVGSRSSSPLLNPALPITLPSCCHLLLSQTLQPTPSQTLVCCHSGYSTPCTPTCTPLPPQGPPEQ